MAAGSNSTTAPEILGLTSPDLSIAAVPPRRSFTNPDGSPSFRFMLAHFRDEVGTWPCGGTRRKIGGFGLRTIGAKLRHLAKKEQIATSWHPLRAVADRYDAQARELNLQADDASRAFAILALSAGRGALATRCHNGCHLMDLLNMGELSAANLAASPLALAGAVALNRAGERLLNAARAIAAPAVALAA